MRSVSLQTPIHIIVNIYLSVYLFAVLAGIFISSYFQISLISMLSFNVTDGWCNSKTQGIGEHCFGDFYYPLTFSNQDNPWDTGSNPYPPFAQMIFKPFAILVERFPASPLALLLYLGFMILAIMIIPTHLYLTRKIGAINSIFLGVVVLSTTPVIVGLDRGNILVFCVPILYFFLHFEREGDSKRAFISWTMLVLIKPQFALLGLIFIRNSNLKGLVKRLMLCSVIFITSFLLYPVGIIENMKSYQKQLFEYQDYGTLGSVFPVNVSIENGLSLVDVFFETKFAEGAFFVNLAVLMFTIVVTFRSPATLRTSTVLPILLLPIVIPQTSWHYYLVVLVPFFIFAITNPGYSRGGTIDALDSNLEVRLQNYWQLGLAGWAFLLFVPWAFPWHVFGSGNTYFGTSNISMHWAVVIWSLPVYLIGSLIYNESFKTRYSINR
jgi:hypothetical protein